MNKKHISFYILAAALTLGTASCKKFTDLTPISEATSSTAYSTAKEAEAALVGAYDTYQQEYYIWDNVLFSDVISDNHYAGGDNPEIFAIDKLDITPTNSRLFSNWSQIYNGISKANVVIQKVPGIADQALDRNNRTRRSIGTTAASRSWVRPCSCVHIITTSW
jgi:starch-binding outer membrane protein, SusD/RagB family